MPTLAMFDNWTPQGALAASTVTVKEQAAIAHLRHSISSYLVQYGASAVHPWLRGVTDVELLRFLRARGGDMDAAWTMLFKHCSWRGSEVGPDSLTATDAHTFATCALNKELYWAGEALDGCPTVIFRTALHEPGAHDPDFYIRFVVWLLERGRKEFGVGTHRQICVVLDRSPAPEGEETAAKSLAVMLPLLRRLFTVLQDNYPEILFKAFVVPVNWVFWSMYSMASSVIDERSRQKITMVKEAEFPVWWQSQFPPRIIPSTLGGSASYPQGPHPSRHSRPQHASQYQYQYQH